MRRFIRWCGVLMRALLAFWAAHRGELALLVQQHIVLVLVSTAAAVAIGIPAGILAARRPRAGAAASC